MVIRCYECKNYVPYKRGNKGKCKLPYKGLILKVDAVDYCDKAEKKE